MANKKSLSGLTAGSGGYLLMEQAAGDWILAKVTSVSLGAGTFVSDAKNVVVIPDSAISDRLEAALVQALRS